MSDMVCQVMAILFFKHFCYANPIAHWNFILSTLAGAMLVYAPIVSHP